MMSFASSLKKGILSAVIMVLAAPSFAQDRKDTVTPALNHSRRHRNSV
jgi:hypothetical protein